MVNGGGIVGSIASNDKDTTFRRNQKKEHIASSCPESAPVPKADGIRGH